MLRLATPSQNLLQSHREQARGCGGSGVGADEKIPGIKVPSMKTLQGYRSLYELILTFYPKEAHFWGMWSVVAVCVCLSVETCRTSSVWPC